MPREIFESAVNSAMNMVRKEEFRLKHSKAASVNEDVMKRFYGISTNGNKPVLVEKITINRIINKHGNNGLVTVSANRSDLSKEENDENAKKLIDDIKKSGYSYLPTYGGYRGTDGVEDSYEPSFVIFNHTSDGKTGDFEKLRDFALYVCDKYNQNSVLIKAPNNPPIWVDKDGNKVNKKEGNKVWKNDPTQEYFTSLKSKDAVDKEIREKLMGKYKTYCHKNGIPLTKDGFEKFYNDHLNDIKSIGRRYTYDISFDECYVNPMPCQLSERMRRVNEIMIWE